MFDCCKQNWLGIDNANLRMESENNAKLHKLKEERSALMDRYAQTVQRKTELTNTLKRMRETKAQSEKISQCATTMTDEVQRKNKLVKDSIALHSEIESSLASLSIGMADLDATDTATVDSTLAPS